LRGQQEAPSMTHHHTRPAPDPDQVIRTAWPTNGPYTAQRTVSAARAAAELVRYLAYATRPAAGLPQPADAYDLIGAVRVLLDQLPQTLIQTGRRFAVLAAAPDAALTDPAHPADPQNPAEAAQTVVGGLAAAARTLAGLSARLNPAHTQAGRLYLTGEDDEQGGRGLRAW